MRFDILQLLEVYHYLSVLGLTRFDKTSPKPTHSQVMDHNSLTFGDQYLNSHPSNIANDQDDLIRFKIG